MFDDRPRHPGFILGGRFPALGTIHSLAPKGVACWVYEVPGLQATWSRYARYWRIPDPRSDDRRMVDRFFDLARRTGRRPVLIPTADHYAQALVRHRAELETRMIPCVASTNGVELLVDKRSFYEWGYSHYLSCPQAAAATASKLPLSPPLIVKPINITEFLLTASKMPDAGNPRT